MKTCNKCEVEKPATPEYFHRNKSKKDGLEYTCKECRKEYDKKYYQENKEKKHEYDKKYYQENKEYYKKYSEEHKEERREYSRNHYQENKEEKLEYSRIHYQENKEHYREYFVTYRLENPEAKRLIEQRRRARKAQLPHDLVEEEWYEILEYFNNECAYCGDSESGLEQEHVIPVSKGGGYTADNIIPACKSCNSSKNARDLEEWYVSYRHYDEERLNKVLDYMEAVNTEAI